MSAVEQDDQFIVEFDKHIHNFKKCILNHHNKYKSNTNQKITSGIFTNINKNNVPSVNEYININSNNDLTSSQLQCIEYEGAEHILRFTLLDSQLIKNNANEIEYNIIECMIISWNGLVNIIKYFTSDKWNSFVTSINFDNITITFHENNKLTLIIR